jgi:hypothetical protein
MPENRNYDSNKFIKKICETIIKNRVSLDIGNDRDQKKSCQNVDIEKLMTGVPLHIDIISNFNNSQFLLERWIFHFERYQILIKK